MRFIIYCRKSTDTEDKQVLSLESQEQELLTLAEREQLEVVKVLKESRSAKEPGRPVFSQMIEMLLSGKIDGVLCWKIDRLTRNPIDGGQIQWLLQTEKIKCIKTFEKSYYPSDNVLLINIEQAMATQYIRDLSVNVKRGNRAKLERGEWPSKAPFGYYNDKAAKLIKVDKRKQQYVVRAFELYASGHYTLKQISDVLYSEGLRSGTGRKVLKSKIHSMLDNKFYCGLLERDGKIYPAKHKVLVTLSLFNKVQDVLHGRKHPRPKKHFYAARGFLHCACGCMLTADTKKGHIYYYCTNGKGNCEQHKRYLRSEAIDTLISGILVELQLDQFFLQIINQGNIQRKEFIADNAAILERLKYEAKLLTDKELMLVEGYTSQIIRDEVYKAKMKEIDNRRAELTQQIRELENPQGKSEITFEQVKSVLLQGNSAYDAYKSGSEEAKRIVLQKVLSNLYIKDQKVLSYQFKSPYDIIANAPKNAGLRTKLALLDDIRNALVASSENIAPIIPVNQRQQLREAG